MSYRPTIPCHGACKKKRKKKTKCIRKTVNYVDNSLNSIISLHFSTKSLHLVSRMTSLYHLSVCCRDAWMPATYYKNYYQRKKKKKDTCKGCVIKLRNTDFHTFSFAPSSTEWLEVLLLLFFFPRVKAIWNSLVEAFNVLSLAQKEKRKKRS